MPNLPTGTVTFAFSDIEGSTALLKRLGDARYAELLATHRRLVRETFAGFGGQEIDTQGDAFFYGFSRARDAVAAAVEVQRAHERARWPDDASVRLRIGLHTGEPAIGEEGYTGLDVVRASRIAATGLGGQVLLSDTTRAIVADDLPDGVALRSLGDRPLRDIDRPEPLSELVIPDVTVSRGIDAVADAASTAAALGEDADVDAETDLDAPFPPGLPGWVSGKAAQWLPGGGRTRDLIEGRVLEAITSAFEEGAAHRRDRPAPTPPVPPAREQRSMSDEIDRLRGLRDAGALSDEQYARAVDRIVGGDSHG